MVFKKEHIQIKENNLKMQLMFMKIYPLQDLIFKKIKVTVYC